MTEKEPDFAFGKTLGIHQLASSNLPSLMRCFSALFECMKETNKLHNCSSEFFRLDFRPPYFDELDTFPRGSLILDFKWGSKKELYEKNSQVGKENDKK